jgi:hypothetical protein
MASEWYYMETRGYSVKDAISVKCCWCDKVCLPSQMYTNSKENPRRTKTYNYWLTWVCEDCLKKTGELW